MVEHQLPKLGTRVRFPYPAPLPSEYLMTERFLTGVFSFLFLLGCAGPSRLRSQNPQEPAKGIYHEVQKGDTLWRISQSYQVPVQTISAVNKLTSPSNLQAGQLLFIPTSGIRPTVQVPPVLTSVKRPPAPAPVEKAAASRFSWPVRGKVVSRYGQSTPLGKNKGMNIAAQEGTPVLASAAGQVSFAGDGLKGYGKTIILDHGELQTVYAHNRELLVKPGDRVRAGQPIAWVGKTGRVPHPTLHFEIRRGNRTLNPANYLGT